MNKKHKLFHFVGFPILAFIAMHLVGFIFKNNLLEYWEALGPTLGISVVHWMNVFYPSKPTKDPDEPEMSLKEDVKKYTVNGSPFNRLLVIIYSLIILLAVVAYVWVM